MTGSPVEPSLSLLERDHPLWKSVPLALQSPEAQGYKAPSRKSAGYMAVTVHPHAAGMQFSGDPCSESNSSRVSLSSWGKTEEESSGSELHP